MKGCLPFGVAASSLVLDYTIFMTPAENLDIVIKGRSFDHISYVTLTEVAQLVITVPRNTDQKMTNCDD